MPSESYPWHEHYHHEWTASGTSALALAIGLAIDAGEFAGQPEVILPAYGCPDLAAAVLFHGARPVLVDLSPESPRLDPSAVEKALNTNTAAVVAVNFLGLGEALRDLAERIRGSSAWLIEDSAQGFPPASSEHGIADAVVLSFGRGKPINLMGGGALLIRRDRRARAGATLEKYPAGPCEPIDARWRLRRHLFNLLLSRPLYGLLLRFPFLGIGATRFHRLESITRAGPPELAVWSGINKYRSRPDWAPVYQRALSQADLDGWLDLARGWVNGPEENSQKPLKGHLLRYPLLAPDRRRRDRAIAALNEAGVGANAFYGVPLPAIAGLEEAFDAPPEHYPNACDFADRLITLPSHQDVRERDVHRSVAVLVSVNADRRQE